MELSDLLGTSFFGLDMTGFAERMVSLRRDISRRVLLIEFGYLSLLTGEATFGHNKVSLKGLLRTSLPADALERGVPSDPAAMSGLIRSICKEQGYVARRAAVVIRSDGVFSRLLEFPKGLTHEGLYEFVDNPSSGIQSPIPLSQTDFDLIPSNLRYLDPSRSQARPCFVVGVPNKLVDSILQTLADSDLELAFLDVGYTAHLRNLFAETSCLAPNQALAVIDLDLDASFVTLATREGPVLHSRLAPIREFPEPSLSQEHAAAAIDNSLTAEQLTIHSDDYLPISELDLRVLVSEFIECLSPLLDGYSSLDISRIYLVGINSSHPGIADLLSSELAIPTVRINPLSVPFLSDLSSRQLLVRQSLSAIVGLGLRFLRLEQVQSAALDLTNHADTFSVADPSPIDVVIKDESLYPADDLPEIAPQHTLPVTSVDQSEETSLINNPENIDFRGAEPGVSEAREDLVETSQEAVDPDALDEPWPSLNLEVEEEEPGVSEAREDLVEMSQDAVDPDALDEPWPSLNLEAEEEEPGVSEAREDLVETSQDAVDPDALEAVYSYANSIHYNLDGSGLPVVHKLNHAGTASLKKSILNAFAKLILKLVG